MKTVGEFIDEARKVEKNIDNLQDVLSGRIREGDDVCDTAIELLRNYLDLLRETPIKK